MRQKNGLIPNSIGGMIFSLFFHFGNTNYVVIQHHCKTIVLHQMRWALSCSTLRKTLLRVFSSKKSEISLEDSC